MPPLPYSDNSFDAVYSLSVFTHLDESMQDRWLEELHRVLRPNGVLFLTIHGRRAAAFLDQTGQDRLSRDGIVHAKTEKLRGVMPAWYQTTWHSETYILDRVSRYFPEPAYHPVLDGLQDVVVARRVDRATLT